LRRGWRGLAAALVLSSGTASAQGSDAANTAAAQTLYDEGMAALTAKDYARACPKFEEAAKLVPEGIGVKLMLAECYEGWGRLASAWAMYKVAEGEAQRANQKARQKKAQDRIAALEPRLARLTVVVGPEVRSAEGLRVTRDGIEVGPSQWGTALPVNKGEITVSAKGAGGRFEQRVTIEDGQKLSVTVDRLEAEPTKGPAPPPVRPSPVDDAPTGLSTRVTAGWVTGAVGLALGGAGLGLGVQSIVDAGKADDLCPEDACTSQEAIDLDQRANLFSILGWVGGAAGVAALTAGIVLVVLPEEGDRPTSSFRLAPGRIGYELAF
jgi:hypothetical protein